MTDETAAMKGRCILVVEDDFLVAQTVVDLLQDAGAEVIGPLGRIDEAITFIESDSAVFDGAVLDLELHGKKSYSVADVLIARGTRFVFATGYGSDSVAAGYEHYPCCEKPFDGPSLIAALTRI